MSIDNMMNDALTQREYEKILTMLDRAARTADNALHRTDELEDKIVCNRVRETIKKARRELRKIIFDYEEYVDSIHAKDRAIMVEMLLELTGI